jgi:hypothetical protein
MRYILPALAVNKEEQNTVQAKIIASMLNKLVGHINTFLQEIRHGPVEMGGLSLINLRTKLGISQLKYLWHAINSDSKCRKLILISIKYSQMKAGIQEPLLENPSIHLPYIIPTWLTSVRQYLHLHTLTETMTDSLKILIRGP